MEPSFSLSFPLIAPHRVFRSAPRFFRGHRKQLGAAACMAEEEKEGCVHIFHSLYDAFGHPISSYYGRGKCLNRTFNLFCLLRGIPLCNLHPLATGFIYLHGSVRGWRCGDGACRKLASPPLPLFSLPNGASIKYVRT